MDYAQVEDGAFATTPILTTTATVTRSADVASMPTTNWHSIGPVTLFAHAKNVQCTLNNKTIVSLGSTASIPSVPGYCILARSTTNLYTSFSSVLKNGSTSSLPTNRFTNANFINSKLAVSYSPSSFGFCGSDSSSATIANYEDFSYMQQPSTLFFYDIGAAGITKCLTRVTYFPKALSESALVEMTRI
jgi:hypothetical protein